MTVRSPARRLKKTQSTDLQTGSCRGKESSTRGDDRAWIRTCAESAGIRRQIPPVRLVGTPGPSGWALQRGSRPSLHSERAVREKPDRAARARYSGPIRRAASRSGCRPSYRGGRKMPRRSAELVANCGSESRNETCGNWDSKGRSTAAKRSTVTFNCGTGAAGGVDRFEQEGP